MLSFLDQSKYCIEHMTVSNDSSFQKKKHQEIEFLISTKSFLHLYIANNQNTEQSWTDQLYCANAHQTRVKNKGVASSLYAQTFRFSSPNVYASSKSIQVWTCLSKRHWFSEVDLHPLHTRIYTYWPTLPIQQERKNQFLRRLQGGEGAHREKLVGEAF
jgi:hypothetical protein